MKPLLQLFLSGLTSALVLLSILATDVRAEWGVLADMHNYHECFGLDPQTSNYPNSGTSPKWKLARSIQSRAASVQCAR